MWYFKRHFKAHPPIMQLLLKYSSVQFSHSVMSDSLLPHGLQHTRPPWQSPTPGVYSYSCPLSRWWHPAISSSAVALSQFFASGGQSIGVSASASVLQINIQDWFPLRWTGWVSLQSKGLWRVFPNTTFKSISSLALSFLYSPTLASIYDYWKNHSIN